MKTWQRWLGNGCLLIGLFGLMQGAWSRTVGAVMLPERATVAESELGLNGAGMRRAMVLDVYVASLYLQAPAKETQQVLGAPGAKRLQMNMLFKAKADDFNKALFKGMRRNASDQEWPALEPRLQRLMDTIAQLSQVRQGDLIQLDFLPGQGTRLLLNGVAKGEPIEGDDFYRKLLEAFIGEHPYDERLKRELLGS